MITDNTITSSYYLVTMVRIVSMVYCKVSEYLQYIYVLFNDMLFIPREIGISEKFLKGEG